MMKVRALSIGIYESKEIGNCSNHGISERYRNILLECEDGNYEVDLDNPPENFCVIDEILGYKFVRPYAKPTEIGWMAGGSLVYTSDSRFRRNISEYPLALHDRQESQRMYDMLSR